MVYSWEMEQKIAATIGELNKEAWFRDLCAQERKASAPPTPERAPVRSISIRDTEALNRNLVEIASGRIVVVDPQKEPPELAENEISASDQTALNENIERIAKGETKVRWHSANSGNRG